MRSASSPPAHGAQPLRILEERNGLRRHLSRRPSRNQKLWRQHHRWARRVVRDDGKRRREHLGDPDSEPFDVRRKNAKRTVVQQSWQLVRFVLAYNFQLGTKALRKEPANIVLVS